MRDDYRLPTDGLSPPPMVVNAPGRFAPGLKMMARWLVVLGLALFVVVVFDVYHRWRGDQKLLEEYRQYVDGVMAKLNYQIEDDNRRISELTKSLERLHDERTRLHSEIKRLENSLVRESAIRKAVKHVVEKETSRAYDGGINNDSQHVRETEVAKLAGFQVSSMQLHNSILLAQNQQYQKIKQELGQCSEGHAALQKESDRLRNLLQKLCRRDGRVGGNVLECHGL